MCHVEMAVLVCTVNVVYSNELGCVLVIDRITCDKAKGAVASIIRGVEVTVRCVQNSSSVTCCNMMMLVTANYISFILMNEM